MSTVRKNVKEDFREGGNGKIWFFEELPTINQVTNMLISEAMKRANGNPSIAAEMLHISQQAMNDLLKYWRLANDTAE